MELRRSPGVRSVLTHRTSARTQAISALLAALVLAACAGEPVALLTGNERGCFAANTTGMLIVDAGAGTAIVSEDMARTTVAVRWPAGYIGRKAGDQVEVLDAAGHAVAHTGQRYELLGGYNSDLTWAACADGVYPPVWAAGEAPGSHR